ncbi:hypothetical protein [Campylobacter sp.]|uniref:hypothetical protein n=1 Tax=Campylobacter sp. TaxID=205 RepID=UPI0026F9B090|nr:hypothetical protein [Campylobacter sp.]
MNFSSFFVVLLFVYILILGLYFLYSKNFNNKFTDKRIKIKQKTGKYFLQIDKKSPEQTDLISQMFFLISSLNEDAKINKNYLIFDYNMSYPRIFNTDASNIIRLTDALAQIMLLNLSNSTIIIKFLLSSYHKDQVKFTLSVWANKNFAKDCKKYEMLHVNMSKKSRKFMRFAKNLAAQNDSDIKFDLDSPDSLKVSTDIVLQLCATKVDILKEIKLKKTKNFSALIAEDNLYAFNILKKDLEFIGIDVKPSYDWEIIKRHIEDTIFNPDIVFIQSSMLRFINIDEIQNSLIEKNIPLVIIKNDSDFIAIDSKIYAQYLPQPYTADTLINILNNAHEYYLQRNRVKAVAAGQI